MVEEEVLVLDLQVLMMLFLIIQVEEERDIKTVA
jgi:hypothetical protein